MRDRIASIRQRGGVTAGTVNVSGDAGHAQGPPRRRAWWKITVGLFTTLLVLGAAAATVFEWVGISPSSEEQMSGDQYNVTSYNQQGGITAGQVNVGTPPPRHLDDDSRAQLLTLVSKSKPVVVQSHMGHLESYRFADEIKDFLLAEGYEVEGVYQILLFDNPISGQRVVNYADHDRIMIGPQE